MKFDNHQNLSRVVRARFATISLARLGTRIVSSMKHRIPSTFLHPFAPSELPNFIATMSALTSAWRVLRLTEHERPTASRQISLLIAFDLPTIPSPTTALPFRHGRFGTLLHRRDLPRLSPGQASPVVGIAVARSRVRTLLGASPTGLAESSSLALRTGRSSQVAPHPSSRKRSYHCRLQAGNVSLRGTSTLQIKRLHRRTSHHAPRDERREERRKSA